MQKNEMIANRISSKSGRSNNFIKEKENNIQDNENNQNYYDNSSAKKNFSTQKTEKENRDILKIIFNKFSSTQCLLNP